MRIINIDNYYLEPLNIVSKNNIINININKPHIEFILEDNSIIVFESTYLYYKFIGDRKLYSLLSNDVNYEELISRNNKIDNVENVVHAGININNIMEIEFDDGFIYHLEGVKCS